MRIRKNVNLSSFMPIQAYDCQLNQSPWDIIPIFQETEVDDSSLDHFKREDNFIRDGSLRNFNNGGIAGSSTSLIERREKVVLNVEELILENRENKMENQFIGLKVGEKILRCSKNDGKGWQCRNESKHGYSLCDYHFATSKTNTAVTALTRRGRPRTTKKGSSSVPNQYEFYYYSGFGPFWGKKRGELGDEGKTNMVINCTENNKTPSFVQIDSQKLVIMDEDEEDGVDENEKNSDTGKAEDGVDDDNEIENSCKKRKMLVKARSLQALM